MLRTFRSASAAVLLGYPALLAAQEPLPDSAAVLVRPDLPAQEPSSTAAAPAAPAHASPAPALHPLALTDGFAAERERVSHLLGETAGAGFLLRSPSSRTAHPPHGRLRILAPSGELVWNSAIPYSPSSGPLWSGKGVSSRLVAGVDWAAGPVRLVLAPALHHAQDVAFDSLTREAFTDAERASRIAPWQTGAHSVDLPYRLGAGTELRPGESSLTFRAGAMEAGAATESQWWGPGVRNAIVLGDDAGGFPHLFVRSARPLRTRLGSLEARWIAGRLSSSPYDTASAGRHRSLSAAAVVLDPGGGLTVGVARSVHTTLEKGSVLGDAPAAFLRWRGAGDTLASRPYEQISAVFARWVAPAEGLEVYGEWARNRLPASLRDLLEQPEHSQGYTVGAGWAGRAGRGVVTLRAEATNLERSATFRARPIGSWYAGRAVPQGYTHRGQPLGAAIGPGASGQWLAAGFATDRWELGAAATRVRWANDAYIENYGTVRAYFAHDVSLLGSLRGGVALGGMWLGGEWTVGRRYNFLFQNRAGTWDQRDRAITPVNHTFRLRIEAGPPPFLRRR
jgi:hypothetical protein